MKTLRDAHKFASWKANLVKSIKFAVRQVAAHGFCCIPNVFNARDCLNLRRWCETFNNYKSIKASGGSRVQHAIVDNEISRLRKISPATTLKWTTFLDCLTMVDVSGAETPAVPGRFRPSQIIRCVALASVPSAYRDKMGTLVDLYVDDAQDGHLDLDPASASCDIAIAVSLAPHTNFDLWLGSAHVVRAVARGDVTPSTEVHQRIARTTVVVPIGAMLLFDAHSQVRPCMVGI